MIFENNKIINFEKSVETNKLKRSKIIILDTLELKENLNYQKDFNKEKIIKK